MVTLNNSKIMSGSFMNVKERIVSLACAGEIASGVACWNGYDKGYHVMIENLDYSCRKPQEVWDYNNEMAVIKLSISDIRTAVYLHIRRLADEEIKILQLENALAKAESKIVSLKRSR